MRIFDRTILSTMASAIVLAFLFLPQASGTIWAEESTCALGSGWSQLVAPEEPVQLPFRGPTGTMSVAADWKDPALLWAGGLDGLHRSLDCGTTWEAVQVPRSSGQKVRQKPSIQAVATDSSGALFVAEAQPDSMVATHDGGRSWQVARFTFNSPVWSSSISPSPTRADLLYASIHRQGGSPGGFEGLARSLDGGLTWELRNEIGGYSTIVADALDADTVYVGSGNIDDGRLFRSLDGGANVSRFRDFSSPVTALSMSTDGSRFWLATRDGSLYRGDTWEQVQDTAYQGHLISISASPHDPHAFFAVTRNGDLWAYREPDEMAQKEECEADDGGISG